MLKKLSNKSKGIHRLTDEEMQPVRGGCGSSCYESCAYEMSLVEPAKVSLFLLMILP